jgi:hypothetical protein
MDHAAFDRMARHLAAGASRRGVVRGAVAAAGSALAPLSQSSTAVAAVPAKKCLMEGERCGPGKRRVPCKRCCATHVTDKKGRKRCACIQLGASCFDDSQCCTEVCDATSGLCAAQRLRW